MELSQCHLEGKGRNQMTLDRVLQGEVAAHLDAVKIHQDPAETGEIGVKPTKTVKTGSGENSLAQVGQSRRGSLMESLVNILVGYSINFVANLLIFPLFGWNISTRENLTLGVIYTGISLVRSYGLRRIFNRRTVRK